MRARPTHTSLALALCLGLSSCSNGSDGGGPIAPGGPLPTNTPGTGVAGAPAVPGAGAAAPVGNAGAGAVPPTAGAAGAPVAGTDQVPMAGTAGAPVAGTETVAGTGAGTGEAGAAAGTGVEPPPMTEFMHCSSGIQNWNTPMQSGPCGSSTTRYGVDIEFGPYGASMDKNVGQGFETTLAGTDNALFCGPFVAAFAADPEASAELQMLMDLDLRLFSVFYPSVMPDGETFPLITWGNGTCAQPEGYGALLRYIASHGYIVVAANSRQVDSGNNAMIKALDFMFAANDDPSSKWYQKVDTSKVGAMGHSQGGNATADASSDPRVQAVILWNGGTTAFKPFLSVSGDRDIFTTAASQLANPVNVAQRPAAYMFYHNVPTNVDGKMTGGSAGHLTLMMEPERVIEPALAWWDMMLKGDDTARQMFVGAGCTLCSGSAYPSIWVNPPNPPTLEYGANAMLQ